ncbi:MAG: hypothetical protein AAF628_33885 [Planctomycetota bacterium]
MGASPRDFFKAIDETLGAVAEVRDEQRLRELHRAMFEAVAALKEEQRDLTRIEADLRIDRARRDS